MAVHIKVQKINRAVAGRTPKFAVEYQVVAPPDGMVRGGKEGVSTSARKRARQVCGVHRASDTQTQCTLTAQAPGPNRHPHLQASLCQCLSLSPLLPPPLFSSVSAALPPRPPACYLVLRRRRRVTRGQSGRESCWQFRSPGSTPHLRGRLAQSRAPTPCKSLWGPP